MKQITVSSFDINMGFSHSLPFFDHETHLVLHK